MSDAATEPAASPVEGDSGGSLFGDVRELAEDTRTALEAEYAFQSARAGFVLGEVRQIAIAGAIAVAAGFVALLVLAFGAVLALTPLIGAVLATVLVVFVLALVAAAAGIVARQGVQLIRASGAGKPDGPA